MESFKPYTWLRKQSSQFNAYFVISIPANYQGSGLQNPHDNTTTGVRTYRYYVQSSSGAPAQTIDSNTGNHGQPSGITRIKILVVDVTDSNNPVNKGTTDTNYQDADEMA